MPQTVVSLKRILPAQRRVGQMAVITCNVPTVYRMGVGNVGISHDVTVHTCFRRVDQIRRCAGDVRQEQAHAAKESQQDHRGNSKPRAQKTQLQNRGDKSM